jgi:hypothetical protein
MAEWKQFKISDDGKYYMMPIEELHRDLDETDRKEQLGYDVRDPYRLRMFDFRFSSYGSSFTVLARSKQQALDYLLTFFKNKVDDLDWYSAEIADWSKVIIEDPNTYPEGYDIIEYEEGGVLETELC